jgi:DNA-binding transcriptional LysR family regulator
MGLMLNLNDLYYFVQVVDHKGFTAAARALKVPKSSLSRRVIELERQLSARLINRTSRNFAVSDVGQELFEHAVAMLAEARSAEDVVRRRVAEPSGPVRFTTVIAIAQFVLPDLLPRFMARFPRVWIIQHATDRMVDMFEENFDLAIRAHSEPPARLGPDCAEDHMGPALPRSLTALSRRSPRPGSPAGPIRPCQSHV